MRKVETVSLLVDIHFFINLNIKYN